jgi:hypothetical protein
VLFNITFLVLTRLCRSAEEEFNEDSESEDEDDDEEYEEQDESDDDQSGAKPGDKRKV